MSHWQSGKVETSCSLNLLRKSLIDMMKDWKDHIFISEDGTLPLYTYTGHKDNETYHLVIPGCANPNHSQAPAVRYSDIGIRRGEDGKWIMKVDISGIPKEMSNFNGKLSASIAAMKVKKIAKSKKNKETGDFKKNGKRYIRLVVPVEDKYRVHA